MPITSEATVEHSRNGDRAAAGTARGDRLSVLDNGRLSEIRVRGRSLFTAHKREGACRALSVAAAVGLLVITAPIMLVVAIAIKLTSRGPVLYTQPRVGIDRRNGGRSVYQCQRLVDYGGRPFRIYKFRTMYVAPTGQDAIWAEPDDPRVTPLGRILRKFRLDELPQLFNVLKGDMDLVGPRPEQPRIFADLRGQIERYEERQRVRPGITGWAQVNQHYDNSIEDVRRKVELDLEYIERKSVVEDMRILLKTVPVVIFKQGAW